MKAIDLPAAKSWCEAHAFVVGTDGLPVLDGSAATFFIPKDAGERVALVRGNMQALRDEEEVCIWIHDASVWPSAQWDHLFRRFRLSYGITESTEERPCLVIPKDDADAATSVVVYAVLMLWDCYVLGASGRRFAFYSHDEVGRKSR